MKAQVRGRSEGAGWVKNGTHSFAGVRAAGIQVVGWTGQREVAGFCTAPATVLGLRGTLFPARGAAVCAAALGLGDDKAQDLGQAVGEAQTTLHFPGRGKARINWRQGGRPPLVPRKGQRSD